MRSDETAIRLEVQWAPNRPLRCLPPHAPSPTSPACTTFSLQELGLTTPTWPAGKTCLDWTERKSHLGGPLGRLLTDHLLTLRWLARRPEGRALRITTRGRTELERFGLPRSCLDAQ
jgi:hypothetical protein